MATERKKRGGPDARDGVKRRGEVWYEDFFVPGYARFRRCLRTSDRATAVALVAAKRKELHLGEYTEKKPEITLGDAIARHWEEQQQYWHSARLAISFNRTLVKHLGKETRLHTLNYGILSAYVATRRASVENITVNREMAHLRAIVNTCVAWGYRVPDPAIPFRAHRGPSLFLPEPDKRPAALGEAQEEALFAAMRADFHPVMRFGLMTGLRRENAFLLRWDQVDEATGWIEVAVKSKKPGRKVFRVGLTPALQALLSRERGNHPEYVFTWVCHKTQHLPGGIHYERGQRYPLMYRGGDFYGQWVRARARIGLPKLRFHDLRHTFATNLVKDGAPLPVVQKAMGHSKITTTMIYDHTDEQNVMEARLRLEQRRALRVVGEGNIRGENIANVPPNDSLTNREQVDAHPVHKASGEG